MAEQELLAITAIKDMEQEGAIAASLIRSGWKVLYRATSPELLQENLLRFSDAVLLLSDDFIAAEKVQFENLILIRGRSHPLGQEGVFAPKSDFELGELIRNRRTEIAPEKILIPATQSKVIALASIQGGVGTSTLAQNVADQLSQLGKRTLLVEANSGSAELADHFELHDIRSQEREFAPNLYLFEITDLAQLIHLGAIAEEFHCIVIDLGLLGGRSLSGGRIDDRIFQWVAHSQGHIILTSGSFRKSIDRSGRSVKRLREIAPILKVNLAITVDAPTSRRERMKLESEISEKLSIQVATFSRDHKAVEATRERATTLHRCLPRSLINREIGQYVKGLLIWE